MGKSKKDMNELVTLAKQGDNEAFKCIIKKLEPFIFKSVRSIFVKGYDNDDLKQLSYIAIMRAVNKFDLNRNSKFISYAMISIKNTLNYVIRSKHKNNAEVSINTPIGGGLEIKDCLEDDYNIEDELMRRETSILVYNICSKLLPEEKELLRFLIKGRGGLLDYSKKYKIPYSTCFKRKKKLFNNLRCLLEKNNYKESIYR